MKLYIPMALGALAEGFLYDSVLPKSPFLLTIVLVVPEFLVMVFLVHEREKREG